jgi:IclR family transcriptional regulator, KDG regulon repressor
MTKKSSQPSRASRSLALRRGLEILSLFTDAKPEWGVTELATHLNEHKSLVHRTVKTLEDAGYLRQDAQNQKYSLGFTAYQLGIFASRRLGFTAEARTRLRKLTEEIDATVYIVVRDGDANRIVDTFEASVPFRFHSPVGTRIPWSRGASSKLLVAFAPEAEVQQMIRKLGLRRFAARTLTDPDAFMAELANTRKRGYAISDNEGFDGILGIAAPLYGSNSEMVAALQSSMSAVGLSEKRRVEIAKAIVQAAKEVSQMLRAQASSEIKTT